MRRFLWRLLLRIFYWSRERWPIGTEIVARIALVGWVINRIIREAGKR